MRAPFNITLVGKSGEEIPGTVKRSTIALSSIMQEHSVKLQFLREERLALYQSSDAINKEFALAEIGDDAERLATAKKRQDALRESLSKKDKAITQCLVDQFKATVNVSKGDKEHVEVSWEDTPNDTIMETINFFSTGKKPLETNADGSGNAG